MCVILCGRVCIKSTDNWDIIRPHSWVVNFGANLFIGGFSPNRWNVTRLWLFVTVLAFCFFLGHAPRSTAVRIFTLFVAQRTCFRERRCLLGVRTMGDVTAGIGPQNPLKLDVNKQFQAWTAIWKSQYLRNCISDQFEISQASWDYEYHFVGGLWLC